MNSGFEWALTIGTALGSLVGLATMKSALRVVFQDARERRSKPKPKHVSIEITYTDGHHQRLEVEPHNPKAAQEALQELESA